MDFGRLQYTNTIFCPICQEGFQHQQDFLLHYQSHLQNFTCSQCGIVVYTREDLNEHVNTFHSSYQKIAPKTSSIIQKIVKTEPGIPTFSCKVCNKSIQSHRSLKRHMKNLHGIDDNFPIPVSLKESPKKKVSKLSVSPQRQNSLLLECDDCEKTFTQAYRLKEHKLSHSSGSHPCPSCNFKFKREYDVKRHMSRMKDRICNYCNEIFQCHYGLESHKSSKHGHSVELDVPDNNELKETLTEADSTTTSNNSSYSLDERSEIATPEKDGTSGEVKTANQNDIFHAAAEMKTEVVKMQKDMVKVHDDIMAGFMKVEEILNKMKNIIEN